LYSDIKDAFHQDSKRTLKIKEKETEEKTQTKKQGNKQHNVGMGVRDRFGRLDVGGSWSSVIV